MKKTTKKSRSNEKPQRSHKMITRDIDQQVNDVNDKENHSNHGFTQLIQTKMMEVKKRQGNRKNKKVIGTVSNQHSSRKRQLSSRFMFCFYSLKYIHS